MKNIIIAGVSRAGKSTLAKSISKKYNYTYIPFDSIVSTLEELYPCTDIKHMDENKGISPSIAKLLDAYIKHLSYEDINYVIDMYQIFPTDMKMLTDTDNHLVVYLGYSESTPAQKLDDIRTHARDKDWTKNTSDEEMISILSKFISEDKLMRQECLTVDYSYFDTGVDFSKTIEKAKHYIESNIK